MKKNIAISMLAVIVSTPLIVSLSATMVTIDGIIRTPSHSFTVIFNVDDQLPAEHAENEITNQATQLAHNVLGLGNPITVNRVYIIDEKTAWPKKIKLNTLGADWPAQIWESKSNSIFVEADVH